MSHKQHVCETCSKICEEAKLTVKKLNKRLYALTIVCTAALTLLGEQGTKSVMSTLDAMNSAMSTVEGKKANDVPEVEKHHKVSIDTEHYKPWPPLYPDSKFQDPVKKEQAAKLEIKDSKTNIITSVVTQETTLPEYIIPNILGNNKLLIDTTPIKTNLFCIPDPSAVFLTPSTLPFDVYCTTIGLGNNYGFGEYYDYWKMNPPPINPVPGPSALTIFGLGALFLNKVQR